jgi:hypothetical protein
VALDDVGARLSRTAAQAGPACANVTAPFVRAPEVAMNHGWHMTIAAWGTQEQKDRFSDSYARAFKALLIDHVCVDERHDEEFSSRHLSTARR